MKDYKTLLVHYDAGRTAPRRLETAIQVATMSEAHVICLYALDAYPVPSQAFEAKELIVQTQARIRAEQLAAARAGYEECLRRTGYAKCEWRESSRDALAAVSLQARYADLVVIGQQNDEWPSGVSKELERALPLAAGRPVLVVPYAFEERALCQRVMVAWDASREAAIAVRDALPLLSRASQVHIVTVDARATAVGHGEEPGADIGLYLARHGVKVTVSRQDSAGVDAGNVLLSRAADLQSDLIVSGAWGHSRLQEFVLGGVTRTLLASMTVPVFMSH
ncbi:MAG: universal stress protein [Burkholderiales bacterium]